MNLSPICLFVFKRLNETQQTVKALQANYLSKESDLFVFSDGFSKEEDFPKVSAVREFIKTIDGFKTITIIEYPINQGLASSIISGVTRVIEQYGKVIVLEDDLVTSPNFLDFMNSALNFYILNPHIFSISGFTYELPTLKKYQSDYYLGYRASSLGWGTWINRWKEIDWALKDYAKFKYNFINIMKFMRGGSDMPGMLRNQVNGRIDSWAIRWCYNQFKNNQFTVFSSSPKIMHIGYGEEATNEIKTRQITVELDTGSQQEFKFVNDIELNPQILKEYKNIYSIKNRLLKKYF
jgi:hypothetical protein